MRSPVIKLLFQISTWILVGAVFAEFWWKECMCSRVEKLSSEYSNMKWICENDILLGMFTYSSALRKNGGWKDKREMKEENNIALEIIEYATNVGAVLKCENV